MPIKNYKDVQQMFSNVDASGAPHKNFWRDLSYDQFVNGNVPGVAGVKILVKGKPQESALIRALSDDDFEYGRMPLGGPYYSKEKIDELAKWIENNCPEF
jgi:hypothetical protein